MLHIRCKVRATNAAPCSAHCIRKSPQYPIGWVEAVECLVQRQHKIMGQKWRGGTNCISTIHSITGQQHISWRHSIIDAWKMLSSYFSKAKILFLLMTTAGIPFGFDKLQGHYSQSLCSLSKPKGRRWSSKSKRNKISQFAELETLDSQRPF